MFRTIFTTLTALLKSGLCATQLCIRSDTASYFYFDDLPVQAQSLVASNPPNIAVTVYSIVDVDIIYGRVNLRLESYAGVVSDVLHRLHHDRPLLRREGAIEVIIYHT